MAALTVTFATPALVRNGDTLNINFSDGSALELTGATGVQDYVAGNYPTADQLKAMAVANRLARDPLLDSPELWDGKAVTLDLEQATPANVFRVQ